MNGGLFEQVPTFVERVLKDLFDETIIKLDFVITQLQS